MNQDFNASGMSPIEESSTIGAEEIVSTWPTVIGVISIIVAISGMLCQLTINGWMFVSESIPEQFRGGMTFPPVMKLMGAAQCVVLLGLGVLLLMGAVALLRRRRVGVKRLKAWAISRLVMIVIGVVLSLLTAPAQIQMQKEALEWQREFFKEHQVKQEVPNLTDREIWFRILIGLGIFTVLTSAYPVFLGFYLSRPSVISEIQNWP